MKKSIFLFLFIVLTILSFSSLSSDFRVSPPHMENSRTPLCPSNFPSSPFAVSSLTVEVKNGALRDHYTIVGAFLKDKASSANLGIRNKDDFQKIIIKFVPFLENPAENCPASAFLKYQYQFREGWNEKSLPVESITSPPKDFLIKYGGKYCNYVFEIDQAKPLNAVEEAIKDPASAEIKIEVKACEVWSERFLLGVTYKEPWDWVDDNFSYSIEHFFNWVGINPWYDFK